MGLFSKKKVPSIDTGALLRIQQETENKQKNIVGGLRGNLSPINQNFQTDRGALSNRVDTDTENVINRYSQDLTQANTADSAARNAANVGFREQAFRDVPELQRSIRESLGGSGLLASGAALSSLSRPVLDAARSSRDFTSQNEVAGLSRAADRTEKLADTGFNARSNAMATRLGLDEGTINALTEMGRGDLIREAEGLLGIEQQGGANRLGIEQARQQQEMAKAAASNSMRSNIISGLTQLGGAGLGFLAGGPMGAGLGAQLGGTAGQIATGSPVSFDPTLLYAMAQRNPGPTTSRTAVINGLRTPVRPYQMGA